MEGFVKINGADICYKVEGEGEALLLIHGNGEDMSTFDPIKDELLKNYKLISMDSRAHGRSQMGETLSIPQIAYDAMMLLEHLHIQNASVVGFSDGANVAMEMAVNYRGHLNKMVLIGGNSEPKGVKTGVQILTVIQYFWNAFLGIFSKERKKKAKVIRLMTFEPHISENELKGITTPALVVAGDKDMIKDKHTRYLAQSISGAELRILKGSHFLINDAPEELLKVIGEFLGK